MIPMMLDLESLGRPYCAPSTCNYRQGWRIFFFFIFYLPSYTSSFGTSIGAYLSFSSSCTPFLLSSSSCTLDVVAADGRICLLHLSKGVETLELVLHLWAGKAQLEGR